MTLQDVLAAMEKEMEKASNYKMDAQRRQNAARKEEKEAAAHGDIRRGAAAIEEIENASRQYWTYYGHYHGIGTCIHILRRFMEETEYGPESGDKPHAGGNA